MVKFIGILYGALIAIGSAVAESPGTPAAEHEISGFGDMAFGDSWRGADGLLPAAWRSGEAAQERVFYAADPRQRHSLGGVRLDWPGLLYRFVDDRLYAVEAEFSGSEQAFAELRAYLSARHGTPSVAQDWHSAPEDTYVYRARLQSVAWYSGDARRAIWLMRDDNRGYLVALDRDGSASAVDTAGALRRIR
jgi:hypothetical protein